MHSTLLPPRAALADTRNAGTRHKAGRQAMFEAPCVGQDESSGLQIISVRPGHQYVADYPLLFETRVGSCVAICLSDSLNRVFGMAVLSAQGLPAAFDADWSAQLEAMIDAMIAKGAEREWLTARVYGAGRGLDGDATAGLRNSAMALDALQRAQITPLSFETGGEHSLHLQWRVPLDQPRIMHPTQSLAD